MHACFPSHLVLQTFSLVTLTPEVTLEAERG